MSVTLGRTNLPLCILPSSSVSRIQFEVNYSTHKLTNVSKSNLAQWVLLRNDEVIPVPNGHGDVIDFQENDGLAIKLLNNFIVYSATENKQHPELFACCRIWTLQKPQEPQEQTAEYTVDNVIIFPNGELYEKLALRPKGGSLRLQPSAKRVVVDGRKRVVYLGPRGGQYVKRDGKFVRI